MKKLLIALLALALTALPCGAEMEETVEFACEEFSMTLPDGMEALSEDEQAALAAGAMADTGVTEDVCAVFLRGPEGRGICVSTSRREDSAEAVARELCAVMASLEGAQVTDPVRVPLWSYDAWMYTVTIEEILYTQTVLSDGYTCLVITSAGMEAREVQAILDTITLTE